MTLFQKRLLIHSSILFVVILILTIGLVLFSNNIELYSRELSVVRKTLASQSNSIERLADLNIQYRKVENYFDMLRNFVPKEDDLISLSRDFQVLAKKANIEHSFSFIGQNAASANSLGSLNFNIDSSGNIGGLFSFAESLENFKYLTRIDSFKIGRNQENKSIMTIKGEVFFRR